MSVMCHHEQRARRVAQHCEDRLHASSLDALVPLDLRSADKRVY
jgi:hypothetical protein